jgi:hypothetical protein
MTAPLQTDTERSRATPLESKGHLPASPISAPKFKSILFEDGEHEGKAPPKEPAFSRDLNLDLIVKAITIGRDEYQLEPFFYTPLSNLRAIEYRHEVMRDLERSDLFQALKSFSAQMRRMRDHLIAAEKLSYKYEKERWLLDAVVVYGDAVEKLLSDLFQGTPKSRGLLAFLGFLHEYTQSAGFKELVQEARELTTDLSAIRYCLLIQGNSVTVREYRSEGDYSAVIEEVFAKFKQGAVKDYRVKLSVSSGLNHVEAQALDLVARLNPEVFSALDAFCENHRYFCERTLTDFDRDIHFYLAYVEYAVRFKEAGLKFCYPKVSETSKSVSSRDSFDLALAGKLVQEKSSVVCNDFSLDGPERILVVTGPNQGGKTTFARTFGQLHYLASLGCPVAGTEARLFLFDRLFTHFEREEDITTLHGKLQDDLIRIHHILEEATPKSIIIINEIFSSTSLKDAVYIGKNLIESISRLDLLSVCVTFLDELASLNEKTVSIVATVMPDNPALRTYRLERTPANGLSYALAVAEKHRLTYHRLKERMRHESASDVSRP